MKKTVLPESPDAYVKALTGWRKPLVERLRRATRAAGTLEERIKWGHLVYSSNGPVLLIRAEDERVLFGFWRGQRLRPLDERLKPGGKYEMATIVLREGDTIAPKDAKALVQAPSISTGRLAIRRPSQKPDGQTRVTGGASFTPASSKARNTIRRRSLAMRRRSTPGVSSIA